MKFSLKFILILLIVSCSFKSSFTHSGEQQRNLSEAFKSYWFNNGAEINTYELEQARYGETRKGKAILVFVTEPFNPKKLVKADENRKENIEVLKLNYLKKFETGIYDYSMMTSVFFPLISGKNALKITSSSQEWCGHTFMQLLNKSTFDLLLHSYFEAEAEQIIKLKKGYVEDEIMNQIRIDHRLLPLGEIEILPSFFYLRLKHKAINYYHAKAELFWQKDNTSTYSLYFPELKRKVEINFETEFPHKILAWAESSPEKADDDTTILYTRAKLLKTKRLKYWENNRNQDSILRRELGL